ncbi:hypothetical protein B0H11DRAFT_2289717 [Mycena galericulata]|nr:hypothetical protein B0H11DRAFT_2289717 [Mycena galericulata]
MAGSEKAAIWRHFHEFPGTNSKHKRACCRACVKNTLRHPPADWNEVQLPPAGLSQEEKKARFDRACRHRWRGGWFYGSTYSGLPGSPRLSACIGRGQPLTLQRLFGKGVKPSLRTRVSRRAQEEEEAYMRVMAELDEEDDTLDDGEVEIDDDEVWGA